MRKAGIVNFAEWQRMIDISFGILYHGGDIISHLSRCGEIGRRSRLKICREQSLTGSSPVSGTIF